MQISSGPSKPDLYKLEMEVQAAELTAPEFCKLENQKRKASKPAENATSGEAPEENGTGGRGGSLIPSLLLLVPCHYIQAL